MKFSYLLIAFLFLVINGCSDFSSEANEFELSGKMYACDESVHGDIANDTKAGKKRYCNGLRWIDLIPEDSTVQNISNTQIMYECKNGEVVKFKNLCSEQPSDYLPLDDTEYPYAGIPRIVIETENHRAIKDRETEIPAKLQIWGESAPESEIMELTIRGRGNTTWNYPKKPYAIKFTHKQSFLGMPKAKKWVMLANYRDRTLIRNALAFKIAQTLKMEWVPQGRFVEAFLNGSYIGNYYFCEKIEINENRLNVPNDGFLLELDVNYDEENKFRTAYKNIPVNIKHPKNITADQLSYIQNFIDSAECFLRGICTSTDISTFIDMDSFAKYWIVQGLSANGEIKIPKSFFVYKNNKGPLKAGPVWDFDWETFCLKYSWFRAENAPFFSDLKKQEIFKSKLKEIWSKDDFASLDNYIDSLVSLTRQSNVANIKKWPIHISSGSIGDESESLDSAITLMKSAIKVKLLQMDSIISR